MEQQICSCFENNLIGNHEIRIFLSSTFSDMDAERSALVKLFNVLKYEANKRNVTLSLLDLRWGVTEEESRTGKVLSVCLNAIENSHPFFIGLLGSRYGYSPQNAEIVKNPELIERYPWVQEDIDNDLSITEIEMQYGALRNKANLDAIFYIKNTPDTQPDDNEKLTRLKSEIKEQKRFPVSDYTSIDDLCKKVETSITDLLNKYFPKEDTTRLGHERVAHKAYMNSRHGHYIKRQEDFNRLDAFLNGNENHLVVAGGSGMGKSALIANWLKEKEQQKDIHHYNIIYHFVGNSIVDNGCEDIIQHINDELQDIYAIGQQINKNEELGKKTQRLLEEAVFKGKPLLIVIDGINQITNDNNSKQLHWLPQHPKVKYLFSTTDDDETMQTFRLREYPIYRIKPLSDSQRREYIINYLGAVGKKLSKDQLSRILNNHGKRNILVLRSLLDELICFGSYERLDERINYYLSADSIKDFFKKLLKRIGNDFENGGKALSLLTHSEHGLTEDEIVGISGLRKIDWHSLYCAIHNHLVIRNGCISFAHQRIAEAAYEYYAHEYYFSDEIRNEIIEYFTTNDRVEESRKTTELAYQYYPLDNVEKLYQTILKFDAFNVFYSTESNRTKLAHYWKKILITEDEKVEMKRDWDIPDEARHAIYKRVCPNYLSDDTAYGRKYKLIDYLSLSTDGLSLEQLPYERIGSFMSKYLSCNNVAIMYYKALLGKVRNTYGDTFNENKILIFHNRRKRDPWLVKIFKYLKIVTPDTIGYYNPEAANYYGDLFCSIGYSYNCLAEYNKANIYMSWALSIRKDTYGINHIKTAELYDYIGCSHNLVGEPRKALPYLKMAIKIKQKLIGQEHPNMIVSLIHIGEAYENCWNYFLGFDNDTASHFFLKAAKLSECFWGNNHAETAICYTCICRISRKKALSEKETEKAIHLYELAYYYGNKAVSILEKGYGLMNKDTASAYHELGLIQYIIDNDKTIALNALYKALEVRKKQLGNYHPDTAETYYYIGRILENEGNYAKAKECYENALLGKERLSSATSALESDLRHYGFHIDYWAVKEAVKRIDNLSTL